MHQRVKRGWLTSVFDIQVWDPSMNTCYVENSLCNFNPPFCNVHELITRAWLFKDPVDRSLSSG